MNSKILKNKREKLDELMSQRNYDAAYNLYQELHSELTQESAELDSRPALEKDTLRYMAQVFAAIVIECHLKDKISQAIAELAPWQHLSYSALLQARLLWLADRKLETWQKLESDFQVSATPDGNGINIPQNSILRKCDDFTQELVLNLLGHIYKFYCLPEAAAQCCRLASEVVEYLPAKRVEYSNYLFDSHYSFLSPQEYFQRHIGFDALFADIKPFNHSKDRHGHEKLRIGYISSDFRLHVVLLFIWAMLTKYNRDEFEVYCFSNGREDQYSQYIQEHTDFWCNIHGMAPQAAAQVIYNNEIDILVDFGGHSENNCLPVLAYKPAPVQVCGIGYFATTGLKAVDYFLTDTYLVNDNTAKYFVEDLLVLPHSHFCYVPVKEKPQPQPAPCLENGYITFGSFNNLTKVNDTVLAVWGEIMRQVSDSRLILKGSLFNDEAGRALFTEKIKNIMGLSEERFQLRGFSGDYLTEYYEMDIALDTFPYPGGGTTCDALYMGVPVITYGDGSHGGNFGVSLLANIGLQDCCAFTAEDYVAKAVLFASDYELLNALHLGLRNMMQQSPVMDQKLYMTELEQAYKEIWQKWLQQH